MISGLNSTGVHVADLRVLPVGRQPAPAEDAGLRRGLPRRRQPQPIPELLQIRFYEQPGIQLTSGLQKEIEKHFTRHELRRAAFNAVGEVTYPARVRESYAQDLLAALDVDAIRARGFRIVVDYGYSATSFVLPLVLGPLGVEAVSAHAFSPDGADAARDACASRSARRSGSWRRSAPTSASSSTAPASGCSWSTSRRSEISVEQALLLYLRLMGPNGRRGKLAFPITVTSQVEQMVKGSDLEVIRTPASLAELTKAAAEDGVIFAGAVGGGYVFPEFLPAYDAVASLCKLLELLAPVQTAALGARRGAARPARSSTASSPCPWSLKGTVMRVLTERLRDRKLDLLDGIKVFDRRGWAQVLPDPDEPVVHIYAEGKTEEASTELEAELRGARRGDHADARGPRPGGQSLKLRLTLLASAA